jgi:hypothetical protein
MPIERGTFVTAVRTVALRVSAEYALEYGGGDQVDVVVVHRDHLLRQVSESSGCQRRSR